MRFKSMKHIEGSLLCSLCACVRWNTFQWTAAIGQEFGFFKIKSRILEYS